jgi:PAS domain S-box-containing protein
MSENEDQFRRLVELSPDAYVVQCENRVVYVNPSGAKLFGFDRVDDLLGRSIWDFVDAKYQSIVEKRWGGMTGASPPPPPIEMELHRVNNQSIDVEITAIPFLYMGQPAIQAVFHDITTRKLVEDQIRHRNIELAALNSIAATVSQSLELGKILDDSLEGLVQLDILGEDTQGMIFLCEENSDILTLAAHRGAPENHPCLENPPRVGECLCGLAVELGEPVISVDCFQDARHTRNWPEMDGHNDVCLPLKVRGNVLGAIDVRLPAFKDIDENVVELLSSVADQISVAIENARLFEEVRSQSEHLRTLSGRLAEAEDAERQRIAMELHDQAGESLTILGINLGIIRKLLTDTDQNELQKYVDESLVLVDTTTERIRDLLSELRPPMLDEGGLLTTLRWYGARFSERAGIEVVVSGDEPIPRLPARSEIALFRITTEALTNVAKHASATRVIVAVECDEEIFRLMISDDGIGFDTNLPMHEDQDMGWGLITMSERAESVGGKLRIESCISNGGTRIITEVPR